MSAGELLAEFSSSQSSLLSFNLNASKSILKEEKQLSIIREEKVSPKDKLTQIKIIKCASCHVFITISCIGGEQT